MSYHDTLSQINHIKTYVKLNYIEVDEFISILSLRKKKIFTKWFLTDMKIRIK